MTVLDITSQFSKVIQEHLELKERNARLEESMPLGRYKSEDPFDNHPLFKTEEQARLEESDEGEGLATHVAAASGWPGEDTAEQPAPELREGLWSRSRDFDWGD